MPKQNNANSIALVGARSAELLYRQIYLAVSLALMLCLGFVGTATATSTSDHYTITETQFGSGASQNNCSESYCAQASAGDTTVGETSSDMYSSQTGTNTTEEPLLEVTVSNTNHDLGTLQPDATSTASSTIGVRCYLSNGYVMQITGGPPSQGVHALSALATPTTSHQGAEQFGINLVANTSPNVGEDPVQVLESGTGVVADDYRTADLFKYIDGDVIASSESSSSETRYTLSMIINVSNVTPGGRYNGAINAVVVPVY